MKKKLQYIGITSGNIKSDFLYYDKIIPIFRPDDFIGIYPQKINMKATSSNPIYISEGLEIHPEIYCRLGKKRKQKLIDYIQLGSNDILIQQILAPAIQKLIKDLKQFPYNPVPILDREINYGNTVEDLTSFSLISQNVLDIDTINSDWKQLYEFKVDKSAKRALRSYRHFWYKNYEGKSLAFVEDDLYIKTDRLENKCNIHGFKLKNVVLQSLIKNKTAYSAAIASLAGIMFGDEKIPMEIITSGLTFSVANLSLTIGETLSDKEQFLRDSEILYLKLVKEKFN